MLSLYISLALLGLAAIDPVGIAIMPILLAQPRPYVRSFTFLGGSFAALMLMGWLFAKGFGRVVLRFENRHTWFVPSVEIIAAIVLLGIAVVILWQVASGKADIEPSTRIRNWLRLGNLKLFLAGAALVAVQSVLDVVFVVAMIRAGQFKLSDLSLLLAVATYAVTALVLQLLVVAVFRLAPPPAKQAAMRRVHTLALKYSQQSLVAVSLILSLLLFGLALG